MVDVVCADRSEVRHGHGAVERRRVDHALRQQAVLVHPLEKIDAEAAEPGNGEQLADQIVGAVRVALGAVFLDVAVDRLLHVEDRHVAVEIHLVHRAFVLAGFENDHADRNFAARIDRFVDDKAVEVREVAERAEKSRENDAEVRDRNALLALFVQVLLDRLELDIDLGHIHRVAAARHDVRGNLVHRLDRLDPSSVFSHIRSPFWMLSVFAAKRKNCFTKPRLHVIISNKHIIPYEWKYYKRGRLF